MTQPSAKPSGSVAKRLLERKRASCASPADRMFVPVSSGGRASQPTTLIPRRPTSVNLRHQTECERAPFHDAQQLNPRWDYARKRCLGRPAESPPPDPKLETTQRSRCPLGSVAVHPNSITMQRLSRHSSHAPPGNLDGRYLGGHYPSPRSRRSRSDHLDLNVWWSTTAFVSCPE